MKTKSQLLEKFNDPRFVERLRTRDRSAFLELQDELFPWLTAFAAKKFGIVEEDAEDLMQDLIVALIKNIKRFDSSPGRFVSWIFQILRNKCVDELRRRQKLQLTSLEALTTDLAIPIETKDTPTAYLSPLEKLPPAIRQAILSLPDRYQQFIGLVLLDVPETYIRDILQIKTPANFRSLKSRVFAKLRAEIQKPNERGQYGETK
jgi:RNA polymerase sigma-70 factor (ECF subfamily)